MSTFLQALQAWCSGLSLAKCSSQARMHVRLWVCDCNCHKPTPFKCPLFSLGLFHNQLPSGRPLTQQKGDWQAPEKRKSGTHPHQHTCASLRTRLRWLSSFDASLSSDAGLQHYRFTVWMKRVSGHRLFRPCILSTLSPWCLGIKDSIFSSQRLGGVHGGLKLENS